MIAYRILFALGLLLAVALAAWIGVIAVQLGREGMAPGEEVAVLVATLAGFAIALWGARHLARRGRPWPAVLVLLPLVLTGLLAGGTAAMILVYGFGPHH